MGGYISEPERLPVAAAKVDEGADKVAQSDTGFGESAAAATRHSDWTIGSSLSACTSHWSAETSRITDAMRKLAEGLRITAANYYRQEAAVAEQLQNAASLLDGKN
ncbi:excreted virulence factor EspC (type VII ESX diderm) [Streptomyces sp. 1114.5]|uniref:type VII secretion target n=1 Tax=Streptomyces sp. 1114.5 TaxID=1938830 RepID=UPI000EB3942C|nr:type VII secretion target [Streptomyces sp. 1114.5]RKT19122.1 excreted virulence factor EspC (type VII ESX diderm) [Streptomyces sp. 1114.5]